jgi:CelD/BcsL family acetyltransferase involved in cellulose biosynthesis
VTDTSATSDVAFGAGVRAPTRVATRSDCGPSAGAASRHAYQFVLLSHVPDTAWADLATRALEPNAFYLPGWARAVDAHAPGKKSAHALLAWQDTEHRRLIGLLPVVSARRALNIPVPVLVAWQAYAPLTAPLLDRDAADSAASRLLAAASGAGAQALLLPSITTDGLSAQALRRAAASLGVKPRVLSEHARARLAARQDAEVLLKQSLGAKKLKELRRQRHRLADTGDITFSVASCPAQVGPALDTFLRLETSGWKGARGTALARDLGDARFVREAMVAMAASGSAEVVVLSCGETPVAAGLVLRHGRRAFFFKIAHDESAARLSPGVQLTLDLTRRVCADPELDDADSIAIADHPMIDKVWRERLAVADMLLPVRPGTLSFHAVAAAIAAHNAVRHGARRFVHAVRSQYRSRK